MMDGMMIMVVMMMMMVLVAMVERGHTGHLELEVLLEDGSEAVPLEEAALPDDLLPVVRQVGKVQLHRHVEPWEKARSREASNKSLGDY